MVYNLYKHRSKGVNQLHLVSNCLIFNYNEEFDTYRVGNGIYGKELVYSKTYLQIKINSGNQETEKSKFDRDWTQITSFDDQRLW